MMEAFSEHADMQPDAHAPQHARQQQMDTGSHDAARETQATRQQAPHTATAFPWSEVAAAPADAQPHSVNSEQPTSTQVQYNETQSDAPAAAVAAQPSPVPQADPAAVVPVLSESEYVSAALESSMEDSLAFLRSPQCRVLPQGEGSSTPVQAASSPAHGGGSKLHRLISGGPNGNISAADIATLYRRAASGLYTLSILHDLNADHVRVFDLDSLVARVSAHHAAESGRLRSQKACLLTHLAGNRCGVFPQPVRITDAHLDLLLTATRNSGSAALFYLHSLTLQQRSFASMPELIAAVRHAVAHPNPFKNQLKQLVSSPLTIVMNRMQRAGLAPTTSADGTGDGTGVQAARLSGTGPVLLPVASDSVVDRLWDVQGAGVDAITHIAALHADAQGFATWPELITAVGANHASVRSSQAESDKFLLTAHLTSPLCSLFSLPLHDITITPAQLETLLACCGNVASVVLYHLEHLDEPGAGMGRCAFEGMGPLIRRIGAMHTETRANDERLQSFLNSRTCTLFLRADTVAMHMQPASSSLSLSLPLSKASVDRLLSLAQVSSPVALRVAQWLNAQVSPPRSFGSLQELAAAIAAGHAQWPAGPPLAPPRDVTVPRGMIGIGAPNYADGSMALDAEEGMPGRFVVDPNELYDDGQSCASSPSHRAMSREGSRVVLSRPSSAAAGGPAVALTPEQSAQLERSRELILEYLNTTGPRGCNLFRDAADDGSLEITEEQLDRALRYCGGSAPNVVLELKRMEAVGRQFADCGQMLQALRAAGRATQTMEAFLSGYHNPDEERSSGGSEEEDFDASAATGQSHLDPSLPESVRSATVASTGVLVVRDSRDQPAAAGRAPSLFRQASKQRQEAQISKALAIAAAIEEAEDGEDGAAPEVRPEYRFTEQDRMQLRQALAASGIFAAAQAAADALDVTPSSEASGGSSGSIVSSITSTQLSQLLILGGGLASTLLHLKRYTQARRQLASPADLPAELEATKESGIYASDADLDALSEWVSAPAQSGLLRAYLGGTAIPVEFSRLSRADLDQWLRACGGSSDLQHYLATLGSHNARIAGALASQQATAGIEAVDAAGGKIEPPLVTVRSAAELIQFAHGLERESRVQTRRAEAKARRLQIQARLALLSFCRSSSGSRLFSAAAQDSELSGDDVDALLLVLSPNPLARSNPAVYAPTESEVQTCVEMLLRFDAVGRRFASLPSLLEAARVAFGLPSESHPRSLGDNLPGVCMSRSQRSLLSEYLSSDDNGLLPSNAALLISEAPLELLHALLVECTATARAQHLQPLHIAGSRRSWPRWITPLHRLQRRSPARGANFTTVASLLEGIAKLRADPPVKEEWMQALITWFMTEPTEPDAAARDSSSLASSHPRSDACALWDHLAHDVGLEIDPLDVQDLLALVGDFPTLQTMLHKLSDCGVKLGSVAALISKVQRVLSFGFFASTRDRLAVEAYFRDSQRNRLLDLAAAGAAWSAEVSFDLLLVHSRCQGARYLLQELFPALEAQRAPLSPSVEHLAARCAAYAKHASGGGGVLSAVDSAKADAVISLLSDENQCGLFSENLDNTSVTNEEIDALIRTCEEPMPAGVTHSQQQPPMTDEEQQNVSLWYIRRVDSVFAKHSGVATLEAAIREGKLTGSYCSAATRNEVAAALTASGLMSDPTATPVGVEFDDLIRAADGPAQVAAQLQLLRGGGIDGAHPKHQYASVRDVINELQKLHAVASSASATSSAPAMSPADRDRLRAALLVDAHDPNVPRLLPVQQVDSIPDAVYVAWLAECAGSMQQLEDRLSLFLRVERHFVSYTDVLPALKEVAHSGLAISQELKASLVAFMLDPETHLFEKPQSHGSAADATSNGVVSAADARSAPIDSATGSELTCLFVVGEGHADLIARLTFLDTIGRRFHSVRELLVALEPLKGQRQPTEDDRDRIVQFLFNSAECTLFPLPEPAGDGAAEEPPALEISASEIDALLLLCSKHAAVSDCMRALESCQRRGCKFTKLNQLIEELVQHPPTATSAAVAPAENSPADASTAAAGASSPTAPLAVASASSVPESSNAAHTRLLTYLASDTVGLFAPLSESGDGLEIAESQLDELIAATQGKVDLSVEVLERLEAQKRGFHSMQALIDAVRIEMDVMTHEAIAFL